MSKPSTKKQAKQRQREKIAKKKVIARRKITRAEAAKKKKLKAIEEKTRHKIKPYRRPVNSDNSVDTVIKIEKNMKILKALEEQYKKEMQEREDLNEMLEKEGFNTLEDKMKHLHEEAEKKAKKGYEKRIINSMKTNK